MSNQHVQVRIGADTSGLNKGVNAAKTQLKNFGTQADQTAKRVATIATVAATASVAIGTALVSKSMAAIDAQAKLAKQLKTSTESIANLELAASLSGLSLEQVGTAAKTLDVRLAEAASGTGVAVDALKDLKLTSEDLAGLDLDEKIAKINTAIEANIDPTRQAAVAADLFGTRAGSAMRQLDAKALSDASDQVERLGLAVSDVDAAKIEAANDAMDLLGRATTGITNQFTIELSDAIEAAANALTDQFGTATDGMKSGVENAANAAIDAFADVLEGGAQVIGYVEDNPDVAKYGILGFMIFGKKGALLGSAIGAAFEMLAEPLKQMGLLATDAVEPINAEIEILQSKIENVQKVVDLLDWTGVSAGDPAYDALIDKATLMQLRIADLQESLVAGSAAEQEFNRIMEEGAEKGTSLSAAMSAVATAIRDAKTAAGEGGGGGLGDILDTPAETQTIPQGEDPELRAEQERLDNLMFMYEAYGAARLASGEDFRNTDLEKTKEFADKEAAALAAAEAAKKAIRDQHIASALSGTSQMFGNLSTLMESENKKEFEIGKKAAKAQVIVDTIAAAQGAYKSLSSIPIVGPALGIAAAGAAMVAGKNRLDKVSATSFGSSSIPGGSSGGGGAPSSNSSTAATAGQQGTGAGQSSTLMVEGLSGDGIMSMMSARSMAEKLIEHQRDGGQVVLL